MRPVADRVVIRPHESESQIGDVVIPDSVKEKPSSGTVVAVGPGKPGYDMTTKEGDEVIFGMHSGTPFTKDGINYLILRETDIYSIL